MGSMDKRRKPSQASRDWLYDALEIDVGHYGKTNLDNSIFVSEWTMCRFMLDKASIQCLLTGQRCTFADKCNYDVCTVRADMLRMVDSRKKQEVFFNDDISEDLGGSTGKEISES
jgi:hypothetical protein